MTIFKGFLIITKRNLLMVFMYLAIFLTIGILASGSDSNTSGSGFHAQALTVGVVDHDGGVLSKGLSTYLSQYHTIRQMPDDTAKLQDALFNRNVSYIVTIPEDFKASCLREYQALPVSKIPGSTDGYYIDQQINTYLNQARVLTDSGYSDKEAAAYILKHTDSSSHVTMLKSASSEKTPGYGYMYQYLPYVLISILCYVMGLIIPKTRKTGVIMMAALLVDVLLCNVFIKNLVARTRPFDVNTAVQLLVAKPRDYSFPSGHTAASFASVTALYLAGEKKMWKAALVLAVLIALSRLYLYVHYPTDIIGGVIFGSLSGYLGYKIVEWIQKKKIK